MRYYFIIGLIIWLLGFNLSWPALLADSQTIGGDDNYPCESFRKQLGFAMGFSIFPLSWIVVPFTTGFYEHGFQFKPLERCK